MTTTKKCGKCSRDLPLSAFGLRASNRDERKGTCRKCKGPKDPVERRRRGRRRWLRQNFGLADEAYEAMHEAQGGLCAICGQPERMRRNGLACKLAVDHDHKTGRIRKLLCASCNNVLGFAKDNPELLEKAADYLREHQAV